jgi:hypothetical protein
LQRTYWQTFLSLTSGNTPKPLLECVRICSIGKAQSHAKLANAVARLPLSLHKPAPVVKVGNFPRPPAQAPGRQGQLYNVREVALIHARGALALSTGHG